MRIVVALLFVLLTPVTAWADDPGYIHMDQDLAAIKHYFNEAVDQVRLIFIVGPT